MVPELLTPASDFLQEDFNLMTERYAGFGKEIYVELQNLLPEVFKNLTFYRNIRSQTKDSFAVYNDQSKAFAIQLDPLSEVIVLWNECIQAEIGTWAGDEYIEALRFIQTNLI